jgi:hypothetical protein
MNEDLIRRLREAAAAHMLEAHRSFDGHREDFRLPISAQAYSTVMRHDAQLFSESAEVIEELMYQNRKLDEHMNILMDPVENTFKALSEVITRSKS